MFYEDPIPPDSLEAMEQVARRIRIPIATGERFFTMQQFATLLERGAVQYIRPDVCMAGGLTQSKKIADLAKKSGRDVSFCEIEAEWGHDAFLIPGDRLKTLIRGFLERILYETGH